MIIKDSFQVAVPLDEVWEFILDVERVAPCMPGAELTEIVDANTYKGRVRVGLGPVTMSFKGKVTLEEKDDAEHRAVLNGSGMEERGQGGAFGKVTMQLFEEDGFTRVELVQDITVQGQAAQVSRGMLPDISTRLTKDFADRLEQSLTGPASDAPAGTDGQAVATAAIGGLGLFFYALRKALGRIVRKLTGQQAS